MKLAIKIIILVLFSIFLFSFLQEKGIIGSREKTIKIEIGGEELEVWVAKTIKEREKGLSGIEKLENNEGMLFVFPLGSNSSFWMKDMLIPIDIIWIDSDKKVVDIKENLFPESYPDLINSAKEISYVLEVNAGFVYDKNIKIGDELVLKGGL
jgi:hypothetical protein